MAGGVIDAESIAGVLLGGGALLTPLGMAVVGAAAGVAAVGAAAYKLNDAFLGLEQALRNASPELQAAAAQREAKEFMFQRERGSAYGSSLASLADSNQRMSQAITRLTDTVGVPLAEQVAVAAENLANVVDGVEMATRDMRAFVSDILKAMVQNEGLLLRIVAPNLAAILDALHAMKPNDPAVNKILDDLLAADVDNLQMQRGRSAGINKANWPIGVQ